jgi:N-acetylglucosaminyldiphosphoundecaprenol N-acetyl-beta-D-mannosaminyltransferase
MAVRVGVVDGTESGGAPRDLGSATAAADVLGFRVARLGLDETVVRCRDAIASGVRLYQASINAAKLVNARGDERLAEVLHRADLLSPDGQSIVWASRVLGDPLPERVAGIDLMFRLLDLAEREGFSVFVLGARTDVLEAAIRKIGEWHPHLDVVGSHHGYFDDNEGESICALINRAQPQLLLVAMSSPRKEFWVEANAGRLDVPVIVGVGGSIDIVAGVAARAPRWMQRGGLEWAFRLVQEPRRLWRRYLRTNTLFAALVVAAASRRAATAIRRPRQQERSAGGP